MKKTPLAILAALGALVTPQSWAQTPAPAPVPDAVTYFSYLSGNDQKVLFSKGELITTGADVADLPLWAASPFAAEVKSGLTVKGSTVAIEGFFLFPKPKGDVVLGLYNAVNAVSSMAGLEYYSISQNKIEPLILASSRVTSTEKYQTLPDPVFTSVPEYQRALVYQKDNRMGDGFSEITWKAKADGVIIMTMKNLQTLNYGIFPLVDPGNLQMLFVVIPLADKVAVYGAMDAKTAGLLGLERMKEESFRNRMRALAACLGKRIEAVK